MPTSKKDNKQPKKPQKVIGLKQNQSVKLELTAIEVSQVMAGLSELKFKNAQPIINKIENQMTEQFSESNSDEEK